MARTPITDTNALARFPTTPLAANAAKLPMVACDAVNGNSASFTGRELLVFVNPIASGGAYTVTITSVADEKGRTADITAYSITNDGAPHIFDPGLQGWVEADGNIYFQASNAGLLVGVLRLPN